MKKKTIFILILILFAALPLVHAVTFDRLDIKCDLDRDDKCKRNFGIREIIKDGFICGIRIYEQDGSKGYDNNDDVATATTIPLANGKLRTGVKPYINGGNQLLALGWIEDDFSSLGGDEKKVLQQWNWDGKFDKGNWPYLCADLNPSNGVTSTELKWVTCEEAGVLFDADDNCIDDTSSSILLGADGNRYTCICVDQEGGTGRTVGKWVEVTETSTVDGCYDVDSEGNPVDNDGDGLANCADPDCKGEKTFSIFGEDLHLNCVSDESPGEDYYNSGETGGCSDGVDNDGDGKIDFQDSDCTDIATIIWVPCVTTELCFRSDEEARQKSVMYGQMGFKFSFLPDRTDINKPYISDTDPRKPEWEKNRKEQFPSYSYGLSGQEVGRLCCDGINNDPWANDQADFDDPSCQSDPEAISFCADILKSACELSTGSAESWRIPSQDIVTKSENPSAKNLCCGNNPDIDEGFLARDSGSFYTQSCQFDGTSWSWVASTDLLNQKELYTPESIEDANTPLSRNAEALSNGQSWFICAPQAQSNEFVGYTSGQIIDLLNANLAGNTYTNKYGRGEGNVPIVLSEYQTLPPKTLDNSYVNYADPLDDFQDVNAYSTGGNYGASGLAEIVPEDALRDGITTEGVLAGTVCDFDGDGYDVNPEFLIAIWDDSNPLGLAQDDLEKAKERYRFCSLDDPRPTNGEYDFFKPCNNDNNFNGDYYSTVYPGAREVCDSLDNDCSDDTQEQFCGVPEGDRFRFDDALFPNERFICAEDDTGGVFYECCGADTRYCTGLNDLHKRRQGGSIYSLREFVQIRDGEIRDPSVNSIFRFGVSFSGADDTDPAFVFMKTFDTQRTDFQNFDFIEFQVVSFSGFDLGLKLQQFNPSTSGCGPGDLHGQDPPAGCYNIDLMDIPNVFEYATSPVRQGEWVQVRIPLLELSENVDAIRFYATNDKTPKKNSFTVNGGKYQNIIALDKIRLGKYGQDMFCSGTYPSMWFNDLDSEETINEEGPNSHDYGVQISSDNEVPLSGIPELDYLAVAACNEIPGYAWTGTQCCGNDGSENFDDGIGGCVDSIPVMSGSYFSLIPYKSEGTLHFTYCENPPCTLKIAGSEDLAEGAVEVVDNTTALLYKKGLLGPIQDISFDIIDILTPSSEFSKGDVLSADYARNNILYLEQNGGGNFYACNADPAIYSQWTRSNDAKTSNNDALLPQDSGFYVTTSYESGTCGVVSDQPFLCDERKGWTNEGAYSIQEITSDQCTASPWCDPTIYDDGVCCSGEVDSLIDSGVDYDDSFDCANPGAEDYNRDFECDPTDVNDGICCASSSSDIPNEDKFGPDCQEEIAGCKSYALESFDAGQRTQMTRSLNLVENGHFSKCEDYPLASNDDDKNLCEKPYFWEISTGVSFDNNNLRPNLHLVLQEGATANQTITVPQGDYTLALDYQSEGGYVLVKVNNEQAISAFDSVWSTAYSDPLSLNGDVTISLEASGGAVRVDNIRLEPSPHEVKRDDFNPSQGDWPGGCCPEGFCWDGKACVSGKLHNELPLIPAYGISEEDGASGYRCVLDEDDSSPTYGQAQWEYKEAKWDPVHKIRGFCPQETQCFKGSAQGTGLDPASLSDFLNTIKGLDLTTKDGLEALFNFFSNSNDYRFSDFTAASLCAQSGTIVTANLDFGRGSRAETFLCQNGEWVTRTKGLAQIMLDIADKKDVATKPYTLFCDKPSESLKPNQHGQFEPFRQIGLEGKYQAFFDESLDLTDEFCVLRVDDRVFVGTSLGQHIDQQRRTTTGALPSFIEAIRNDPEYCANVDKTSPTWQGCKNNDVWYNPATKMVIYGFSDGSNVDEFDLLQLADLEEETVFSTVFDTLDLVFSRILSFIGIGIYEDTLETKQFVEEARNFDKLYIAQGDNGRFVRAVKESITRELEDGSRSGNAVSFMTAEYHNIISPVCRTYLDPDFDYQFRMVGSEKTSGVVDGSSKTIPHQPRFTCELDIRSANDWTYIVHVEDLSRGLQFKNAGTEELPFEFADLWRDLTSVMRLDEGFSKDDVYKEEATSTSAGSITITKATSQGLCTSTTLSSVVAGQPFCINVSGLSAQDQEHILGITYSIGERNASVLGAGPVIMSFVEGSEESLPLQAKILYDNFAVRTASTTLQRYAGPFFNPHVDAGNISVDIADDRGYATWNINWDFYDINTLITSENCVGVSAGDDRCSVELPSSGRKVKLTATDTYGIIVERTFNYR